jgi:uncharacterized membrane protein YfcA
MFHINFALSQGLLGPTLKHLPPLGWLVIIGALFLGGIVKGVVSIGVPLIAIPLLTGWLTVKQAVLLLSLPIIIGNIPQALEGGKTWTTLKNIWPLVLGTVIGIAVGVRILLAIPTRSATGIAGIILACACLFMLVSPKFKISARRKVPLGLGLGFICGLMEGVAAIPGPLLATYLLATGATGRRFTKEIAIVLVISVAMLIVVFGESRHAAPTDLLISALAAVPVVAGIILGRPLRDALSPRVFRIVVLVCIFLAAVQMVFRAI